MSTVGYEQRDTELIQESVSVIAGAISNGDLRLSTVKRNLDADLCRLAEINGHERHESELRDLRYRIMVRRQVLAEFEEG